MFSKIRSLFSPQSARNSFRPIPQTFIRDVDLAAKIHREGYAVVDFIDAEKVKLLLAIYSTHNSAEVYSVDFEADVAKQQGKYSGVISTKIHEAVNGVLGSSFDRWFKDYYVAVNAFAVKTPGNFGKVPVHQDVSDVDELKFSTISIWLPLQDMSSENGTLQLVPYSHQIFIPYRAGSIAPYTQQVEDLIAPYFVPLFLKAGQALFFDSRMFHYSPPNLSSQNRVISLSRICPAEAAIVKYYKDPAVAESEVEVWQCPDDYLIHSENHAGAERPKTAILLEKRKVDVRPLSRAEFAVLSSKYGLEKVK